MRHYQPKRYKLLEVLGKGKFGVVTKALDKNTELSVAIKKIDKVYSVISPGVYELDNEQEILHEVESLSAVDAICQDRQRPQHVLCKTDFAEDQHAFYIITEFLDQYITLEQFIVQLKTFSLSDQQMIQLCRQLLQGLQDMHSVHVAHRDIKPSNIMIYSHRDHLNVKFVDFGLSCHEDQCLEKRHAGSPIYAAPEIFFAIEDPESPDTLQRWIKTDEWSLGIVLLEIIGHMHDQGFMELVAKIRNVDLDQYADAIEGLINLHTQLTIGVYHTGITNNDLTIYYQLYHVSRPLREFVQDFVKPLLTGNPNDRQLQI